MSYFDLHIFCCTNTRKPGSSRGSCGEAGAESLRDYMKRAVKHKRLEKSVRVNIAGCLDRCELGPCMVIYPEGVWYGVKTEADIDAIIAEHLENGRIVERLQLQDGDKAKKG